MVPRVDSQEGRSAPCYSASSFGGNIAELGGELCVVSNYSERPALVTLLLMITKQGTAREFIGDEKTGSGAEHPNNGVLD